MSSKWSSKSCEKGKLKKGPWTFEEDIRLLRCIKLHGPGRWNALAKASGLQRCGKSCRLRWVNYLRPDLKRGSITPEEERLILDLHARLGNRWSLIAEKIPGRTDNEIKNFWRSRLRKQRLTESQVGREALMSSPKVSSFPLVTISTSTASQTQPLLQAGEYRNDNYLTQVSPPPNLEGSNLNEQSCGAPKDLNNADNAQHGALPDSAGVKWEQDEGYYRCSWPEQDHLTAFLCQLYLGIHVGDDVAASNPLFPTNTGASTTSLYVSDDGDQSDTCLDLDVSGTLWNPIGYMS